MAESKLNLATLMIEPDVLDNGDLPFGSFFGRAVRVPSKSEAPAAQPVREFVYDPDNEHSSVLENLEPGTWIVQVDLPAGTDFRQQITLEAGQDGTFIVPAFKQGVFDQPIGPNSPVVLPTTGGILDLDDHQNLERQARKVAGLLNTVGRFDAYGNHSKVEPNDDGQSRLITEVVAQRGAYDEINTSHGIVCTHEPLKKKESVSPDRLWRLPTLRNEVDLAAEGRSEFFASLSDSDINVKSSSDEYELQLPTRPDESVRSWLLVRVNESRRLLSVPPEWRAVRKNDPIPYSVHLKSNRGHPTARLYIRDPDVASLVRHMTPNGISDASVLVEAAHNWLFHKSENPVAAACGGYVLLANKLHDEERARWFSWLENLDNRYPWLPDAAVLRGVLSLQGPKPVRDFVAAAEHFRTAYHRGIPYYSLGCAWLQSGLKKLVNLNDDLADLADHVEMLSRRLDTSAVFSCLRI